MKTCAILNHNLTQEQIAELGGDVHQLTPDLKSIWGQIPPDVSKAGVWEHLKPIEDWLEENRPDQIVCQGDFTAFALVCDWALYRKCPVLVATSRRETVETVDPSGCTTKTAVFRHVQFRRVI